MTTTPFVPYSDLKVEVDGHVATVTILRPPHNYFDMDLIAGLVDAFQYLDSVAECRVAILTSEGKSFCAGANFNNPAKKVNPRDLYKYGVHLFRTKKPIIAAVNGAAIGGGLGVAMVADYRVVDANTRFAANFNRLGFTQGFGLSVTLPRAIGHQQAAKLFHTGRRIDGVEAMRIGLGDVFAQPGELMKTARAFADEIAESAPLAVMSTRETLRLGLAEQVDLAVDREASEQERLMPTADFSEGVKAMGERRPPRFIGA